MSQEKLIEKVKLIPPAYQAEVENFLDFRLEKKAFLKPGKTAGRKLGLLKGKLKMAPDFDDALDDFKNDM